MPSMRPDQIKKLEALGSRRRIIGRTQDDKKGPFICELIDTIHGSVWATGHGISEESALDDALKNASPHDKPKTTPELLKENEALRKRLAELEQPKPAPEDPPAPPSVEAPSAGRHKRSAKTPTNGQEAASPAA